MAKKSHLASKMLVGAGAVAAIATGAALFLTKTKTGKEAVKQAKGAAHELSKKITSELHRAGKISQKMYNEVVDQAVDEYAKRRKLAKNVSTELRGELKKEWKTVKREIKK